MAFLICLLLVGLCIAYGSQSIKVHARVLYGLALLLAAVSVAGTAVHIVDFMPALVEEVLWNPLAQSTFATAVFVYVMYVGALKRDHPLRRKILPIRAELSIIAGILTLGHNFSAGQTYFTLLLTAPQELSCQHLCASLCSLAMMLLMLPLLITAITVTDHDEDEPYWSNSLVTVDRILTEQKLNVDGVTGATKSCNGIKRAVRNALKKAKI